MADSSLQGLNDEYARHNLRGATRVRVYQSGGNWVLWSGSINGANELTLIGATDRASAEVAADTYVTSNFTTVRLSQSWVVGLEGNSNVSVAYFVEW